LGHWRHAGYLRRAHHRLADRRAFPLRPRRDPRDDTSWMWPLQRAISGTHPDDPGDVDHVPPWHVSGRRTRARVSHGAEARADPSRVDPRTINVTTASERALEHVAHAARQEAVVTQAGRPRCRPNREPLVQSAPYNSLKLTLPAPFTSRGIEPSGRTARDSRSRRGMRLLHRLQDTRPRDRHRLHVDQQDPQVAARTTVGA
jgi:hypothetical protein